jgi:hypothetical protein
MGFLTGTGALVMNKRTSEDVARRAYELFLSRDGQHGRDMDDWLESERQLTSDGTPPRPARRSHHTHARRRRLLDRERDKRRGVDLRPGPQGTTAFSRSLSLCPAQQPARSGPPTREAATAPVWGALLRAVSTAPRQG